MHRVFLALACLGSVTDSIALKHQRIFDFSGFLEFPVTPFGIDSLLTPERTSTTEWRSMRFFQEKWDAGRVLPVFPPSTEGFVVRKP